LLVHCKSQTILEFGYACIKETVSSITGNIHNREIARWKLFMWFPDRRFVWQIINSIRLLWC
jgi:hypothetical protein